MLHYTIMQKLIVSAIKREKIILLIVTKPATKVSPLQR